MLTKSSESEVFSLVKTRERIAITGSGGGIGRYLARELGASFDVAGIVRGTPDVERFAALRESEIVIHSAVDMKSMSRKAFLRANQKLDEAVLSNALSGKCRLFVYFSSMVVYSGVEPLAGGYREDQELIEPANADAYTQLKLEGEARVIEACRRAGVDYLILRPTIVTGPGLVWSDQLYRMFRRFPVGVRGALMNVIHVEDLCHQVAELIRVGPRNHIYNLGTHDVESETFFAHVGQAVGRRSLLLPRILLRLLGGLIPSTVWFFQKRVTVNCEKAAHATWFHSNRPVENHFLSEGRDLTQVLREQQRRHTFFKTQGVGYFDWFNKAPAVALPKISTAEHRGVVAFDGELVTVRAGTRISEISDFLDRHDRALATLPEFGGMSAGSCFFVDVHGSSSEHYSLLELIEEVKYLNTRGEIAIAKRSYNDWADLQCRDRNFILLELTFRTRKSGYLSNRLEWCSESELANIISHRKNFSTTVQWYLHDKRLLVYNINEVAAPVAGTSRAFVPYRGLPYRLFQTLAFLKSRGRAVQVDRFHRILSPWRKVPFESVFKWIFTRPSSQHRDLEIRVSIDDGLKFISALKKNKHTFSTSQSFGIRFSQNYLWIEMVSSSRESVEAFIALARKNSEHVHFHQGKSVRF